MAKLPEGRSTLTDEQMIGLTHRLVDTCIDCKGKIEELEERLKAAQDDAKEAEAYAAEVEKDAKRADAIWSDNYEALKAKLAKAMDFIEDLTGCEWPYDEEAKRILAELTGGKDE